MYIYIYIYTHICIYVCTYISSPYYQPQGGDHNSHVLPQSPAGASGRVAYDDEAPAFRYCIRYNNINAHTLIHVYGMYACIYIYVYIYISIYVYIFLYVPENLQRKSPEYVKFRSSSQMPCDSRIRTGGKCEVAVAATLRLHGLGLVMV